MDPFFHTAQKMKFSFKGFFSKCDSCGFLVQCHPMEKGTRERINQIRNNYSTFISFACTLKWIQKLSVLHTLLNEYRSTEAKQSAKDVTCGSLFMWFQNRQHLLLQDFIFGIDFFTHQYKVRTKRSGELELIPAVKIWSIH